MPDFQAGQSSVMGSILAVGIVCTLYIFYVNRPRDGCKSDSHTTEKTLYNTNNAQAIQSTFNNIGHDQININYDNFNDSERREIGDWLSPLNFKTIQSEIFQSREKGTGQWLLESKEFKDWCKGESKTLWCSGIPGAGKTILASIIINYLQTFKARDDIAVVYIYCNYKQQTEQTAVNLVTSLLKQLVQDHWVTYDNVRSLYRHHTDRCTSPTFDEFRDILQSEIERYPKVYIVVDALDECPETDGTRARLLSALRSFGSTVSLLVTSRNLASIEADFRGTKRLDIHAIDEDIRRYIEGRIPREPRLAKHVDGHQPLQEQIVKNITESVRGMFLLARLHLDSLATTVNRLQVRQALQNLPKEVDDIYDETMKRVQGQIEGDRKLADQVFSWVIYAYRQLTLRELQHALAVSPGMTELEPDALVDETILMSVCAGLVVVDKKSSVVRLVHYTAQEYFERTRKSQFPGAQVYITRTCITYLSFDVFRKYHRYYHELRGYMRSHSLLEYAARYWGYHIRGCEEEIMKDTVLKFLQDVSDFPSVTQVMLVDLDDYWRNDLENYPQNISQLHISSFFGLGLIAKYQLQDGIGADLNDTAGRAPLSWAAEKGHAAVVKLLLGREDIDVNAKDRNGETPLFHAAGRGHQEVVKLLLARKDVDVNSQDNYGQVPLSWVAYEGHEGVAKLLLAQEDVNVNLKSKSGRTPLSWAAERGYEAVVKLLIAKDNIDFASTDKCGQTPLSRAIAKGHSTVADLLLAHIGAESAELKVTSVSASSDTLCSST